MIRINLLPEAQKKARPGRAAAARVDSGGGGNGAAMALLVVFILVLGAGAYHVRGRQAAIKATVKAERDKLAALEKKIADEGPKADEIQTNLDILNTQQEILATLDNRILWSEKVSQLAKLIPSNVFLNEITVNEEYREVETEASKRARAEYEANKGKKGAVKPEIQKRPIISYNLRLTGMATGENPVQQLDNVQKFHEALVAYSEPGRDGTTRRFMDNMNPQIDFEYVRTALFEKQYPVQQFVFRIKTVPQGEEPKKPGSEGVDAGKDQGANQPAPGAKK